MNDLQFFLKKQPLTNNPKKDYIKMILRKFNKILILTPPFSYLYTCKCTTLNILYQEINIIFIIFFLFYVFLTISALEI